MYGTYQSDGRPDTSSSTRPTENGEDARPEPSQERRPGNLIKLIPGIMRSMKWTVAADTMDRWFSRKPGDISPVENILTIEWANEFGAFTEAANDIKSRATNQKAEESIKKLLSSSGLSEVISFDHTKGRPSEVDKFHYQSSQIEPILLNDLYGAIGKANIHMVAKGTVGPKKIRVTDVGYYIVDSFRFNEAGNLRQPLGVWDFLNKELLDIKTFRIIDGSEIDLSPGEYAVRNADFVLFSIKYQHGADFTNYSDINSYRLDNPARL
jgi:hypothetical protein